MTPILDELNRLDAVTDGRERAACVDLGELARIADENELGVGSVGLVDEFGELAGADHSGFVDNDHGVLVEVEVAGGDLVEGAVDGLARDTCTGLEFGGGTGRECGTDESVAVEFVCGPERVGGGGLACSGLADDEVDRVTRGGDPFDHESLLIGEVWALSECGVERGLGDDADAGDSAFDGEGDGSGLELEDLGRGVDAGDAFDGEGAGEVVLGAGEDLFEARAVFGGDGDATDDGSTVIGRVVLREVEGELLVGDAEAWRKGDGRDRGDVEVESSCSLFPLAAQDVVGEIGFFVGPGGECGDARSPAGGDTPFGHFSFNVSATLAELSTNGERDTGTIADAVPVDRAWERNGEPFKLALRDLSEGGGRFLHTRATNAEYLAICWKATRLAAQIRVVCKVRRCRPCGPFYDLGGEFVMAD